MTCVDPDSKSIHKAKPDAPMLTSPRPFQVWFFEYKKERQSKASEMVMRSASLLATYLPEYCGWPQVLK